MVARTSSRASVEAGRRRGHGSSITHSTIPSVIVTLHFAAIGCGTGWTARRQARSLWRRLRELRLAAGAQHARRKGTESGARAMCAMSALRALSRTDHTNIHAYVPVRKMKPLNGSCAVPCMS